MVATDFIKQNPILSGVGLATSGVVVGALAGSALSRSRSKSTRRKNKSVRRRSPSRRRGRRRTPHTAGKRKDTSHRRIRYTKKGQPYVIKADGRARFISMRSAGSSHKRKGGKY